MVGQLTSRTLPPSRVATYNNVPFGCTNRWCEVAVSRSESITVFVARSIFQR